MGRDRVDRNAEVHADAEHGIAEHDAGADFRLSGGDQAAIGHDCRTHPFEQRLLADRFRLSLHRAGEQRDFGMLVQHLHDGAAAIFQQFGGAVGKMRPPVFTIETGIDAVAVDDGRQGKLVLDVRLIVEFAPVSLVGKLGWRQKEGGAARMRRALERAPDRILHIGLADVDIGERAHACGGLLAIGFRHQRSRIVVGAHEDGAMVDADQLVGNAIEAGPEVARADQRHHLADGLDCIKQFHGHSPQSFSFP